MTGEFALKQSYFLLGKDSQFCISMVIQFLNFFYHPHTQTLTNPHHHTYKISPGTNQIRLILIHIIKHPHRGTQLDEQTLEDFTVLLIGILWRFFPQSRNKTALSKWLQVQKNKCRLLALKKLKLGISFQAHNRQDEGDCWQDIFHFGQMSCT